MIGSTMIAEKNRPRLAEITCPDDLDGFVCLHMDVLSTSDFATLTAHHGPKWTEGPPICFEPDAGMALFKVSAAGLAYVLSQQSKLDDAQKEDARRLADFVRIHGDTDIYGFATF